MQSKAMNGLRKKLGLKPIETERETGKVSSRGKELLKKHGIETGDEQDQE